MKREFSKRNNRLEVMNLIVSGLDPLADYCENDDGISIFAQVDIS
jgi:hypothetical protein